MPKISFSYADRRLSYSHKTALKSFIATLFQNEGKTLSYLNYVFCSDEYLLQVNNDFLHHNYYTDIITFDLSEELDVVSGEIYISLDRVRDNASSLNLPFNLELLRVVFHGALHLCGYADKKKSEIAAMRKREEHYMRLYEQTHFSS